MAFTVATIILFSGRLVDVAGISVFGIFVVFALVNLSVISLRFKQPNLHRPFTSPFTVKRLPILPVLGLVMTTLIMLQFNPHVISSALVPLISIIILCLILIKEKLTKPKIKSKELNANHANHSYVTHQFSNPY
jgi:APA family basic amino acid/polyamine antiporter